MPKHLFILFIFISCKTNELLLNKFPGCYEAKGKEYFIELLINKDGTFLYKKKSLEILTECKGSWKYLGGDIIQIECMKSENPIEIIASGYIGGYKEKIVILNKEYIKLDIYILKRIKIKS